jgi:hypothetical protein
MHRLLLAFGLLTLLTGCMPGSSPEDRAVAVVAADDRQCQSYGAQPWTSAYIRCRLAINERRQQSAAVLAGVTLDDSGYADAPGAPHVLMGPQPIAPAPPSIRSRY